ncbi:MAG: hypothetical protein M3R27_14605 [Bacteroidota bacterium]|nr:hypothetical protein [Bacteroidota bacterium]
MKKIVTVFVCSTVFVLNSCMSEKGMPIPKGIVCDSVISYSTSIAPLVALQCEPCHSGSSPAGGYDFSTYETVKAKADDGRLQATVVDNKTMPQPGSGYDLTEEERLKFACWISQGAPNN